MRVSKVKALEKKILSLKATRRRQRLDPPYDCSVCEGFQCIEVTKHKAIYIFHCKECDSREIVPAVDWLDDIDHFCLVSDKWLAERFHRPFEEPEFEIEIEEKDRKYIHELQAISFGVVKLFKLEGGERLPISIKEALKLPKEKEDRGVVNWTEVMAQIIESGEYWSAKEVNKNFVKSQVKVFRTKTVLDKAVENGIITRLWDKRRFVYGRNLDE